jgi:hypothetical protein
MTDWLLWTRGLRGQPVASVLHWSGDNPPKLTELEARRKLAPPVKLLPEEQGATIAELCVAHPAPLIPEDA